MTGVRPARNASTIIGLSEEEAADIVQRLDELDSPCDEARQIYLASHLANALEGYIGIEREMLMGMLTAQVLQTTPGGDNAVTSLPDRAVS